MPVDHVHIMQLMVGYTCVGVFISTAVISILSLVGVMKIDPDHSKKLFNILIAEVVAISVAFYGGLIHFDPAPIQNKLASADDTKKELVETNKALTNAELRTTPGTVEEASVVRDVKPRIYIQISNATQKDVAGRAADLMKAQGFLVPSVETVGARSPGGAEVRYFSADDQGAADKIVAALKSFDVTATPKLVSGNFAAIAKRKQFEIWFPKV